MRPLVALLLLLPAAAWGAWDSIEPAGDFQGQWRIERLAPDHNRAYFEASQSSQSMLFESLGWGWPSNKASLERNLDTMQFHYQQHSDGKAYSYALLSPGEEQLRGAVFVAPVQQRPGLPGFEHDQYQMEITFWVNQAGQSDAAAAQLVPDIMHWLEQEWAVTSVLFPVSSTNEFARRELNAQGTSLVHENENADELLYHFRAR
jgi:hypothetical protein